LLSAPAAADSADAHTQSINLPADDLVASLELLAKQSGIEFIYDADQLKGIKTHGVSGNLTPKAAVMELLEGANLTLIEHNGAILIAAPQAGDHRMPNSTPSSAGDVGNAVQLAQPNSGRLTVLDNADAADADRRSKKGSVLDEIVVTGTHIRGEVPVGSALVVYTRADIEQSGSATLDRFARNMTANFSSVDAVSNQFSNIRFSPTGSSNGTNTFQGASFNLHGLGPSTTLTLLNGQRLAPGGLDGSFTDISQIPLSAVDHIEVLPDGASAIYGTDAVAGVVNIVTRREFTGAETTVRYGGSTEGGADEVTSSQLLGKSWSTGNAFLNYEFDDQKGLNAAQRNYIPNLGGPYSLIPRNRRNSIFIASSQDLGAKSTISADVLYSDRHFVAANTFNGPPILSTQGTLASGSARQLNVTMGLDVAISSEWHVQVSGNYSRSRQTSDATTSVVQVPTPLDIVSIEAASPSILDFNAITQGSIAALPGGPVKAALGVSYRREKYESTRLETSLGQTTSTGQPESTRQVVSVYGEIVAPAVLDPDAIPGFRRLDLSIAGRYDHYSDFNSTLNPKLGLSWEVIPGLSLKGTFGTSFQAPLLSQVHTPLTLDTQLLPDTASLFGTTDTIIIQGGNLNLRPETSKSYTGGFDLKPTTVPGFSLGMNFFYINVTGKISTPPTSSGGIYSLNDPLLLLYLSRGPFPPGTAQAYFGSPAFAGDSARLGPSAVQAIFDDRLTNLGSTAESGLDLASKYGLSLDPGRLNLSLNVERLLENNSRTAIFGPVASLLNAFAEPPKWKGRASALWTQGPLTVSASINYVNSYRNSLFIPSEAIDSWTTGDLYLGYKAAEAMPWPLRQWVLALSITNVTDAHPPRVRIPSSFAGENVIPFDPANASPLGRVISLSVGKRW
jgi:outer membrane receptor protein involved in Fe transport